MIADKLFKSLAHSCEGYEKFLNGNTIEPGYKPDYVLRKGTDFIILESENSSSRKTFVGGLIKAAHFLQGERTGILVFIIVPKVNAKASTIASHLGTYFSWVKEKTNLRSVLVIEAGHYYNESIVLKIGDDEFNRCAIKA
ncbi:hypothetical protein PV783_29355 [Chitinophaga sp. CC14]|uniref:hypothetical protein n=1 Tax=Chitinophaga sp. CC14 TaxID=3029199 RepID=UPI003B763490